MVSQGVPCHMKTTPGCHADWSSEHYGIYSIPDVSGDGVLVTDG